MTRYCQVLLFIILPLLFPLEAISGSKSITINWVIQDTTDLSGYKMYYSYDSNTHTKYYACETNNPNATSLTCTDINIKMTPVYVTIAAIHEDTEFSSLARSFNTTVSFTVVNNLRFGSQ